jgi:uncharacterized protein YhjY with autotransporter beta-barrel domain
MNPRNGIKTLSQQRAHNAIRIGLLAATTLSGTAHAGLLDIGKYSNQIESDAAIATQAIYNQLSPVCLQAAGQGACTGDALKVWRFINEVVINADDIVAGRTTAGQGTPGTLGRPNTLLLGRALQWCSGEEFTALGSQASAFTGGQIANLASRVAGLRLGSSLRIASNGKYGYGTVPYGGGASGDEARSGWSAFVNGDYTDGDHQVTTHENAFDFIGRNFTAGVDKRVNDRWVAGVILGHQSQNLTFVDVLPTVAVNVVDANSNSRGNSLMPYALYQGDNWFFNASVGYQKMRFDLNRRINYGSGAVSPTPITHDTLATSSIDSNSWSSYETLGFSWRPSPKFIIEPSLSADWRHITIDEFTEADVNNAGFNFVVDEQRINSLEVIPALRVQYSFTPGYGVWTPYVDAQWHKQLRDQARDIRAVYAGVAGLVTDAAKFNIHSDAADDSYQVYTAGFSAILSGSQHGGVQVYGNYRWYRELQDYSLHTISAGLRYEF